MADEVREVWVIAEAIERQFPKWPSTFGRCCNNDCENEDAVNDDHVLARGSGRCLYCLEAELAEHVGPHLARWFVYVTELQANVHNQVKVFADEQERHTDSPDG